MLTIVALAPIAIIICFAVMAVIAVKADMRTQAEMRAIVITITREHRWH